MVWAQRPSHVLVGGDVRPAVRVGDLQALLLLVFGIGFSGTSRVGHLAVYVVSDFFDVMLMLGVIFVIIIRMVIGGGVELIEYLISYQLSVIGYRLSGPSSLTSQSSCTLPRSKRTWLHLLKRLYQLGLTMQSIKDNTGLDWCP